MTQMEDFRRLARIETDDCVLWPHRLNERGYGSINRSGHERRVHRMSLILATGQEPPPTTFALHSCLNRHCLNPRHLRWGTAKENAADRMAGPNHNYGQRHGRARLTEDDVRTIRRHAGVSRNVMARWYGVSGSAVQQARSGDTWKRV